MIAILILISNRSIIGVLSDVISAADTEVTAKNGAFRGIDATAASVIVTDSYDLSYDDDMQPVLAHKDSGNVLVMGDPLPAGVVDKRGQLPPTKEQFDQQRIADLEIVIADMYERGIL